MKAKLAIVFSLIAAAPAASQVGYPPERSPYRDLDRRHEFTLVLGTYRPSQDPAGVAPRGGPVAGFQYEWRGTDALHLAAGFSRTSSERTVIDPAAAPGSREVETRTAPLYALDGLLGVSLTGAKSWHRLVPMVNTGLGVVSDFHGTDGGGFRFGTRFAFLLGGGVRWVPGGRFQLRADVTDRMYTISYPESYYSEVGGATPVLPRSTATSRWTHNPTLSIGLTYFAKKGP